MAQTTWDWFQERARQEGVELGRQQGVELGARRALRETVRRLAAADAPMSLIRKATGLSDREVREALDDAE